MIKNAIAIMTSGGDSPGMNAAARAVVRTAIYEGIKVYGIHDGYDGMLKDDIVELTGRSVSDIVQRGGTFETTDYCYADGILDYVKELAGEDALTVPTVIETERRGRDAGGEEQPPICLVSRLVVLDAVHEADGEYRHLRDLRGI